MSDKILITPEEQIANVQAVLLHFVRRLHDHWGITMRQARKKVAWAQSRGRRLWRCEHSQLSDCWAAVSALEHWRQLKAAHARGELKPIVDDDIPF